MIDFDNFLPQRLALLIGHFLRDSRKVFATKLHLH
jgi:hypothetical protein